MSGIEKKCVICFEDVPATWNWVSRPFSKKDTFLEHERVNFVLRDLLKVPQSLCEKYLRDNGSPSSWITTCSRCLIWIKEAFAIHSQLKELMLKLNILSDKLRNEIGESWTSCSSRNAGGGQSGSSITKQTRNFVFYHLKGEKIAKQDGCRSKQLQEESETYRHPSSLCTEKDSLESARSKSHSKKFEPVIEEITVEPTIGVDFYSEGFDNRGIAENYVIEGEGQDLELGKKRFPEGMATATSSKTADKMNMCMTSRKTVKGGSAKRKTTVKKAQPIVEIEYSSCPWKGCKKSFSKFSKLHSHMQLAHFAKGPDGLGCSTNGCKLTFPEKFQLQHHEQRCALKPHGCTWKPCEKRFRTTKLLYGHITAVHKKIISALKCSTPGCLQTFPDTKKLKIHETRCQFRFNIEMEDEAASANAVAHTLTTGGCNSVDMANNYTTFAVAGSSTNDNDFGDSMLTDSMEDVKPAIELLEIVPLKKEIGDECM